MEKKKFDCFRIDESLMNRATRIAKSETCSRAAIYRKALIEYLEKNEKK